MVSAVGVGCNAFGARIDADQTKAVVDAAIEQGIDPVEHVHHQRRADLGIVEEIRHVETDEPGLERQLVAVIVEHPAKRSAP